ncbi:MAG: hypothetical protein KC417_15940, partial [Myxococcales bacterium]|nr:hypothetical protein [Myxococcales bacterium]
MPPASTQMPLVLTCPAGAEAMAVAEAKALGLRGEPRIEPGRIHYARASFRDAATLALWHRTSERVWLVAAEFHARHRNELEQGAARAELDRFLPSPDAPVHLRVSTHRSRLHHTDAVAEWFRAAATLPAEDTPSEPGTQTIALRIARDHCQVWIDARGPSRGRRGWRERTGAAPLPEPVATCVLRAVGWTPEAPLIDPCCGSGTIPIEAALLASGRVTRRTYPFPFHRWTNFDPTAWREALEALPPEAPLTVPLVGADRDAGAIAAATGNGERAGVSGVIEWRRQAISELAPPEGTGWIVTNPPYG